MIAAFLISLAALLTWQALYQAYFGQARQDSEVAYWSEVTAVALLVVFGALVAYQLLAILRPG